MDTIGIWFLITIGSVILIFEGGAAGIAKLLHKWLPEWATKLILGVVIFIVVMGILLLINTK